MRTKLTSLIYYIKFSQCNFNPQLEERTINTHLLTTHLYLFIILTFYKHLPNMRLKSYYNSKYQYFKRREKMSLCLGIRHRFCHLYIVFYYFVDGKIVKDNIHQAWLIRHCQNVMYSLLFWLHNVGLCAKRRSPFL